MLKYQKTTSQVVHKSLKNMNHTHKMSSRGIHMLSKSMNHLNHRLVALTPIKKLMRFHKMNHKKLMGFPNNRDSLNQKHTRYLNKIQVVIMVAVSR